MSGTIWTPAEDAILFRLFTGGAHYDEIVARLPLHGRWGCRDRVRRVLKLKRHQCKGPPQARRAAADAKLTTMFNAGATVAAMAEAMATTPNGVYLRMGALGLSIRRRDATR